MFVKVFDEESEEDLEEKINSFLSDNDYELFDIKYQINSFAFGEVQIYSFSALLLLKK